MELFRRRGTALAPSGEAARMERTPYRIAYVIGELTKGGAEYQLHELLRHLDREQFEPRVIALAAGGCWSEPIRQLGIEVREMVRRGSADVGRLRRLRAELRGFKPDLLHTMMWPANTYGRLAAARLGIPVVVAAERVVPDHRWWQVLVDRVLDRTTDAYLVNCNAIAGWLVETERLAYRKITVIPNGIDLQRLPAFSLDRQAARRAAGRNPARRLVAQVARLESQKDWPTFLRAAAMVAAELPDVDFLAVGEGTLREELEALSARLGLTGRVAFTGVCDDVPALLAGVDVLALTSTFEGFPNVLLEAMATGAVAIATDVGGCRELVSTGETGLLVPPRAPAAVAAAVTGVLRDGALARRLALAARRRVESGFAVDVMAERTMAFYRSLLRSNRGPVSIAAA